GNSGIAGGGDRLEQFERAAKFLVEDGARQVVAARRAAAEKEPTAQQLFRFVDRDVRPGHPRVADRKRGRRQSAKPATDDMRLHRSPPWTLGLGGPSALSLIEQATGREQQAASPNISPRGGDSLRRSMGDFPDWNALSLVDNSTINCPFDHGLWGRGHERVA